MNGNEQIGSRDDVFRDAVLRHDGGAWILVGITVLALPGTENHLLE